MSTWKRALRNYKDKEEEDRISSLSDELIHKIMSFMDTKYAVETCVLSKSWESLWKSLPCLCFDYSNFPSKGVHSFHSFYNFITQVLIRRHHTGLDKVCFKYEYDERDSFASILQGKTLFINAPKLDCLELGLVRLDYYEQHRKFHGYKVVIDATGLMIDVSLGFSIASPWNADFDFSKEFTSLDPLCFFLLPLFYLFNLILGLTSITMHRWEVASVIWKFTGDQVAIPAMLLASVLCFDNRKSRETVNLLELYSSKGHKYIWYALPGYAIGLVTALAAGILTRSPQPALFYLVFFKFIDS
ncbi:hypothetical protein COLO4_02776 [Corchorus olitorius]|uniref:F-box domain-containing protein n=1 Tax=Corchorus olitorius TaxID=93759 RepID=A0A1R3L0B6_9ROSI|nr:hypothetical protein COLO4_02776 [Corchorus olitorius]